MLGFSTHRVKYANLHLNGDMHDNGNAKYAESGGFRKLIFSFFFSFIFSLEEEGLLKNIRDLNTITCHTKDEGEFFHVRISRLEQSRIF